MNDKADSFNLDFLDGNAGAEKIKNKKNDNIPLEKTILFDLTFDDFCKFVKIIDSFNTATHLIIKNSQVKQYISNSIVFLDISESFKNLDFTMIDLPKCLELFNILVKNKTDKSNVVFYIEDNNYIVKKKNISITLPNQETISTDNFDDDFSELEILGNPVDIIKKDADDILTFYKKVKLRDKDANFFKILIENEQLKGVHIHNTVDISFSDEEISKDISDTQYLSLDFLSLMSNIKCKFYRISLFRNKKDNELYIKTLVVDELFKIHTFERLTEKLDICI